MADKQFEEMIGILRPHARQFIFTRPKSSRAKHPAELQRLVEGSHAEETVAGAIRYARVNAPEGVTILICGSLYLVGEARPMLE